MNTVTSEKYNLLKARFAALSATGVLIAFSGGVDSTLLLWAAHEACGERAVAVTARSCNFPESELAEAQAFCEANGIRHIVLENDEFQIEGYAANTRERCYICKTALLGKLHTLADELGLGVIAEGTNFDDDVAERAGFRAVVEQGVQSPLRDAELTKAEIRELLRHFGFDATAEKASLACLATRVPFGEEITREKIEQIGAAERVVFGLGLRQARVRHHGTIARIETDEDGFRVFADRAVRERVHAALRELGFKHIALDLLGYRTGSMGE